MAYIPLISRLAPKSCDDLESSWPQPSDNDESSTTSTLGEFTSRASYETAVPGLTLSTILPNYPAPPGLKFITKKKTISATATRETTTGSGTATTTGSNPFFGAPEEDPSGNKQTPDADTSPFGFFRRYWYILLPLFIMNFLSKPEEPVSEQAQQQQQQRGGNTQVGAAVAPPTMPAQQQPQQRDSAAARKRRGKRVTT